jgi:primosomal protein N' (replication factor Y)
VPSSPTTERTVAVAVPVPGLELLTYRVPDGTPVPPVGARVLVPVGARSMSGVVAHAPAPETHSGKLRDLHDVLDDEAFLPPRIVELSLWVAEYYACGPGDVLMQAMPPSARRGQRAAYRTIKVASLVSPDTPPAVTARRQRDAVAILREHATGATLQALVKQGVGAGTIRTLVARGVVAVRDDVRLRDPFAADTADGGRWTMTRTTPVPTLTAEQHAALTRLEAMAAAQQFGVALVHGVTGSGKTEIYLHLAARVLAAGRRVLMLVPEIALTPSLAGLVRSRFGTRVGIQHSALGEGERHDQWQRIRRGDIDLVVGTRSAVFAPLEHVGLVIVDEEHEAAYKQEESPRYHGRDVAVVRGRIERALVVLGSATPSLESAENARKGRYALLHVRKRVLDRPLASVDVIDMRQEYAEHGPDVPFSQGLLSAIDDRLQKREQVFVLLNRRGFARVIFCRECGASLECPHCSVALTYHQARRQMRCHFCNYVTGVPRACGRCSGQFLEQSGFGTERLEADLRARFPAARIARVDRDTIRRRGAIAKTLQDVAAGNVDILVGTQMIAKGHDFPSVTLVGVVSADVGLGVADFRASERTFQLLTQVVGRAGRGATPGQAIVQTLYPNHYSIRTAAAQDYDAFVEQEMGFRRHLRYPPVVALISTVVRGKALERAMEDAEALVALVRRHLRRGSVLGPAPAAIARLKDEFRVQFFVKGTDRRAMREAVLAALRARPEVARRVVVDVDPVSVL